MTTVVIWERGRKGDPVAFWKPRWNSYNPFVVLPERGWTPEIGEEWEVELRPTRSGRAYIARPIRRVEEEKVFADGLQVVRKVVSGRRTVETQILPPERVEIRPAGIGSVEGSIDGILARVEFLVRLHFRGQDLPARVSFPLRYRREEIRGEEVTYLLAPDQDPAVPDEVVRHAPRRLEGRLRVECEGPDFLVAVLLRDPGGHGERRVVVERHSFSLGEVEITEMSQEPGGKGRIRVQVQARPKHNPFRLAPVPSLPATGISIEIRPDGGEWVWILAPDGCSRHRRILGEPVLVRREWVRWEGEPRVLCAYEQGIRYDPEPHPILGRLLPRKATREEPVRIQDYFRGRMALAEVIEPWAITGTFAEAAPEVAGAPESRLIVAPDNGAFELLTPEAAGVVEEMWRRWGYAGEPIRDPAVFRRWLEAYMARHAERPDLFPMAEVGDPDPILNLFLPMPSIPGGGISGVVPADMLPPEKIEPEARFEYREVEEDGIWDTQVSVSVFGNILRVTEAGCHAFTGCAGGTGYVVFGDEETAREAYRRLRDAYRESCERAMNSPFVDYEFHEEE